MASNTTPPSDDLIPSLYLSDTFYTWFNNTNDLINKVNPIEVYSITADTTGYLSSFQKDGITIDNLGNGNYRIGYILPVEITGGHTFTQHIRFDNGLSGSVVNFVNGRTGEIQAVTTISGRAITSTINGVANVEDVVFSINGVTASTFGSITLDAVDIPNTVAGTGPEGTILSATGGGSGVYSVRTELFTATPAEQQIAVRFRGTSGGTAGRTPNTVFAYDSARGVCSDYLVWVNALNADSNDGSTVGGMLFTNAGNKNDIFGEGFLAIGCDRTLQLSSNLEPGSVYDHMVFRFQKDGTYSSDIVDSDIYCWIRNSGAPSYAGMSFGVDAEGLITSGLDIKGKVLDKNGTPGTDGQILVSNSNSKVAWGGLTDIATSGYVEGGLGFVTLSSGGAWYVQPGASSLTANSGTASSVNGTATTVWQGKLLFLHTHGYIQSNAASTYLDMYYGTATGAASTVSSWKRVGSAIVSNSSGGDHLVSWSTVAFLAVPSGHKVYVKYQERAGNGDSLDFAVGGYNWHVF